MHLLAIDYGTKRIGLAWTDTDLGVVLPFGIISEKSAADNRRKVVELIKTEKIDKVIIGLPFGLGDDKENANMARVRAFGEELQQQSGLPVEFYDERFSSQQADRMGGDASRDEKSAMIILEDYVGKFQRSNSK